MKLYEPDIQVVMWNWDKFYLFTITDKFIRQKEDRPDLNEYISDRLLSNDDDGFGSINFYDKLEIVPIIPSTFSASIDINGGGSLVMNFVLNPNEVYKHELLMRRNPISDAERDLRNSVIKRYELIRRRIEEDSYYYKETEADLFSDEIFDDIINYSEPTYIFQPMNIVWVFAKDRDEKWCKLWTGLLTNITENDSSGLEREITVKGISFLEKSVQIPIVHQRWSSLLFPKLIERQSAEQKAMWIIWLSSSLLPPSDSPSFDALSQNLEKVFKELGNQFNRSMGLIPLTSEEKSNIVSRIQKNPVFYGEDGIITGNVDEKVESFFSEIKRIRPYRFRIYGENFDASDINSVYKGGSNYIALEDEGYITINDLVNEDGSIARIKWGENWVDPDRIMAYNKILNNTAKLWDLQFTSMNAIYKKISNVFQTNIYNDVSGDLIMDYPHYNSFPTDEEFTVVQSEEHYKDMDARYIIDKFSAKFNFTQDIGKISTMLTVPAEYHYGINLNKLNSRDLTGYSWGSLEELLTYGLSRVDLPTIFTAYGVGDPETTRLSTFLDNVANDFRQKYNQDVFSGTMNANAMCNLQVGRNCLIVHKEKTYFISSMNTTWSGGNSLNTTFNLTHGKSLWKELPNPWKNDLQPVLDLQTPEVASKGNIESWLIRVNMENVCKVMKEKLPEMMSTVFGSDYDTWVDRVNYLCNTTKDKVWGWSYMQSALYSLLENSEDNFVVGGNIVIDPRLMYIAAMLSAKVYVNRYSFQEVKRETLLSQHKDIIDGYPVMKLVSVPYFKNRRKCGRSMKITGIALTKVDTRSLYLYGARGDGKEMVLDYCRKQTEIHPLEKIDILKQSRSDYFGQPTASIGVGGLAKVVQDNSVLYEPSYFDMGVGERVAGYISDWFNGVGSSGVDEFGKKQLYLNPTTNEANPFVATQEMKSDSLGVEKTRQLEDKKIEAEQSEMDDILVADRICEEVPSEIEVDDDPPPESNVKASYFGGNFITFNPDTNYALYACWLRIKQNFKKKLYHDEILLSLSSDFSGEGND